ncbi:M91 family zinc metallopeptidase [Stackebrandtia nassauensis]|uniref:RTX toxins and related Ca2+-binding protein-like protein n=1 Tax=Stackebrandtia nassauensis (strain DSM 44728 / CIP 108903 / NRRL B-16338 / NBRC 102104 / LLR-40K-21) TaxID=446470 RepID=D3Q9W2_STANL|nr:M91 family zinc metallopeptidase [Stackebrandtia nassauensis]ADD44658.1 RTX toxins and related Ca2+-binding protein- like protein [Stackebrandtia nassauensis DSM 44728]
MRQDEGDSSTVFAVIRVAARLWRLEADPADVHAAANGWRSLGGDVAEEGEKLNGSAQRVYGEWAGEGRTSYETHQKALSLTMVAADGHCETVAGALDAVGHALTQCDDKLRTSVETIIKAVPCTVADDIITFTPKDAEQQAKVLAATAEAKTLRAELDKQLAEHSAGLSSALTGWNALWNAIQPLNQPLDGPAGALTLPDGSVVVNTGTGNDNVKVTTDKKGNTVVKVNGVESKYPPEVSVIIRSGQGDDTIRTETKEKTGRDGQLTVLSGSGNDKLDMKGQKQEAYTGAGNDTVDAKKIDFGAIATAGGNDIVNTKDGRNFMVVTGEDRDLVNAKGSSNNVSTGLGDDRVFGGDGMERVYTGPAEAQGPNDPNEHWDEVHAGKGDDTIVGGSQTQEIYAGDGNDVVYGAAGNDYLDGQKGDDKLYGGQGLDVAYGLDGADLLHGGSEKDFLEGGQGNDMATGGSGNDAISGGGGDDRMAGDDGDDVFYGGKGHDVVAGGEGANTAHVQAEDAVVDARFNRVEISDNNDAFDIKGSDDFKDRVQADLDMMAASPTGQQMLDDMSKHDNPEIRDYDVRNGRAVPGDEGGEILYNPAHRLGPESTPATVLYHEMAHSYDFATGNWDEDRVWDPNHPDTEWDDVTPYNRVDDPAQVPVRNGERQAVGLEVDHDNNPATPPVIDDNHRIELTENGLRQELGRETRPRYGSTAQPTNLDAWR